MKHHPMLNIYSILPRMMFPIVGILIFWYSAAVFAAPAYPDGTLLRASGNAKVYIVSYGKKRWIPNETAFLASGFRWSDVRVVRSSVLEQIPVVDLIRGAGGTKIYVLNDASYKRHIPTPAIFTSYGFRWGDVTVVSQSELDAYLESRLVRTRDNPRVYLLEGRKKRWIPSPEVFHAHGLRWGAIHFINSAELAYYENGEAVGVQTDLRDTLGEMVDITPPAAPTALTGCQSTQPVSVRAGTTYLVVGRKLFASAIQPFIAEKQADGERVLYVDLVDVICSQTGRDIPEKLRNFLKQAHAGGVKYLVLLGTPLHIDDPQYHYPTTLSYDWEMPIRYIEGISKAGFNTIDSIPTDQYYASLSGTWDDDGDGVFGEYLKERNLFEFSLQPDMYVGRVPVQTAEELARWVAKTNVWLPKQKPVHALFVSQRCIDRNYPTNQDGSPRHRTGLDKTHEVKFHYCNTDRGGNIADFANTDGADFVSTYSHGTHAGVFGYPDPLGYDLNKESPAFRKPPILFVHGCQVGGLDYSEKSLGEHLMGTEGGVTAMVASTRSHWDINFEMWDEVFFHHHYRIGEAVYEFKYRRHNLSSLDMHEIKNLFMFNLYGDPALRLIEPEVELLMDNSVAFGGQDEQDITFTIKNLTSMPVTGRMVEPQGGGIASVCSTHKIIYDSCVAVNRARGASNQEPLDCSLNEKYMNQCTDITLGPHETKSVTKRSYNPRVLLDSGEYINFVFEPTSRRFTIGADASLLKFGKYVLSCARVEETGGVWDIYTKAVDVKKNEDDNVTIKLRRGGYYNLDARSAAGTVPWVTLYQSRVNFFQNPEPIFTVHKIADGIDDRATNPTAELIAPMLSIESRNGGSIAGECEVFVPENTEGT